MDIAVEYKIRDGHVIFGVVVRNGADNPMQNVQVIFGVPDLTDTIKTQSLGTVDPDTVLRRGTERKDRLYVLPQNRE